MRMETRLLVGRTRAKKLLPPTYISQQCPRIVRKHRCPRYNSQGIFFKIFEKGKRGGRIGGQDDRTSESAAMYTHTRGAALVKRSAIPRDIVPALNQVRLPLNCSLTLSQVHGRIRKTKESLTSTATMHGTAAHSNELLAIAKMTTRTRTTRRLRAPVFAALRNTRNRYDEK